MSLASTTPEANYLTRNNIVLPAHIPAAEVTAMEARARADIAARARLSSVSGATIAKAKN